MYFLFYSLTECVRGLPHKIWMWEYRYAGCKKPQDEMAAWSFWDSQENPLPKVDHVSPNKVGAYVLRMRPGRSREMWKDIWSKIVDYMSIPTLNGSEVIRWGRGGRGLGHLGTPAGLLKTGGKCMMDIQLSLITKNNVSARRKLQRQTIISPPGWWNTGAARASCQAMNQTWNVSVPFKGTYQGKISSCFCRIQAYFMLKYTSIPLN